MKNLLYFVLTALLITGCSAPQVPSELEIRTFELAPGCTETLSMCYVRKNTTLKAVVKGPVTSMTLGRGGREIYWGAWVDVTADSVMVYEHDFFDDADQYVLFNAFEHGLDMRKGCEIQVITQAPDSTGTLVLKGGGHEFSRKIHWRGGGTAYLTNNSSDNLSCSLSFLRGDVHEKVWFIADSYFCEYDNERWPYYMVAEGHLDFMADHLPGGTSLDFVECFREDLRYGKPEVAVWMMGMNDYDDLEDAPEPDWMIATQSFLTLCRQNGITPVLVTVPTVPERFHDRKAEWVRQSGFRYIDWYEAVGAKPWDGSEGDLECLERSGKHRGWDADYLYPDEVHPSENGSKVLWEAVKKALPEL